MIKPVYLNELLRMIVNQKIFLDLINKSNEISGNTFRSGEGQKRSYANWGVRIIKNSRLFRWSAILGRVMQRKHFRIR